MRPARLAWIVASCSLTLPCISAFAAGDTPPTLADYQKLLKRVEQLEQTQSQAEQALNTERISEKEPELVTRLKAVEFQTLEMQKQARQIEALEGVSVGASLTGVLQRVAGSGSLPSQGPSRASYRGDVSISLPGGQMGDTEGQFFTHFRFGQGSGVGLRPTYTSTINSTAFETNAGPDDSFAVLAQAWYQLNIPLPLNGFKPHSREHLEINVGKMDPFLFFDQNAAADDETARFMNNAFVHNPLLDSGGDVGVDAYGFSPGARLAYVNDFSKGQSWGASIGVFGSGPASNFSGSLGKPFVIAQVDTSQKLITGLTGNYRLYVWQNGRANDFSDLQTTHRGWGLSIDQRVDEEWTLFGRMGRQTSGRVRFDRTYTFGVQTNGNRWGRSSDELGLALGSLHTSSAYRQASADTTLVGYAATGPERNAELYYRYKLNDRVQLSPNLQWIKHAGADASAKTIQAIGFRMKVGF